MPTEVGLRLKVVVWCFSKYCENNFVDSSIADQQTAAGCRAAYLALSEQRGVARGLVSSSSPTLTCTTADTINN